MSNQLKGILCILSAAFFAILMSIFLLKEKAKKMDWIIVAIAFVGAIFVVKPSFSMAAVPGIIGFIGGFGAAIFKFLFEKKKSI